MSRYIAMRLTYDQISAMKLVLDPYTRKEDQQAFYLNSMRSTIDAVQAEMNFHEDYGGQGWICDISHEEAVYFCSLFENNTPMRGGEITRNAAIKYIEETGLLTRIKSALTKSALTKSALTIIEGGESKTQMRTAIKLLKQARNLCAYPDTSTALLDEIDAFLNKAGETYLPQLH